MGHQAAASPMPTAPMSSMPVSSMAMTSIVATASGSATPDLPAADAAHICDHNCTDASHGMDTMGGQMCLAVVTIATLLLLGLGRSTRARDLALTSARAWRSLRLWGRVPPPHLTPSLSHLCILRI
ncbi:MAG: hypothetical protein M3Y71_08915 [Actinomycetota bacterium]|nr:hypothetical protein [Actinomycetota bacterium]